MAGRPAGRPLPGTAELPSAARRGLRRHRSRAGALAKAGQSADQAIGQHTRLIRRVKVPALAVSQLASCGSSGSALQRSDHAGPASASECCAAQRRQACPEEPHNLSWGTAKAGTFDHAAAPWARRRRAPLAPGGRARTSAGTRSKWAAARTGCARACRRGAAPAGALAASCRVPCVESKVARTSASWLSGGSSQRQSMP